MGELKTKLKSLGLLHDAVVHELLWKPKEKIIEFTIEDLYANFEGRPEYPGPKGGIIILTQVRHVEFDISFDENYLFIYEFEADDSHPDGTVIKVLFRPSGRIQIACGVIQFPELTIPTC